MLFAPRHDPNECISTSDAKSISKSAIKALLKAADNERSPEEWMSYFGKSVFGEDEVGDIPSGTAKTPEEQRASLAAMLNTTVASDRAKESPRAAATAAFIVDCAVCTEDMMVNVHAALANPAFAVEDLVPCLHYIVFSLDGGRCIQCSDVQRAALLACLREVLAGGAYVPPALQATTPYLGQPADFAGLWCDADDRVFDPIAAFHTSFVRHQVCKTDIVHIAETIHDVVEYVKQGAYEHAVVMTIADATLATARHAVRAHGDVHPTLVVGPYLAALLTISDTHAAHNAVDNARASQRRSHYRMPMDDPENKAVPLNRLLTLMLDDVDAAGHFVYTYALHDDDLGAERITTHVPDPSPSHFQRQVVVSRQRRGNAVCDDATETIRAAAEAYAIRNGAATMREFLWTLSPVETGVALSTSHAAASADAQDENRHKDKRVCL
jgi:hypothetical protein